jgi:ribulose bisphosphate carboxylase small subunit
MLASIIMQSDVAETIYEQVKELSSKQQEEVLEFVGTLKKPQKTIWEMWQPLLAEIPQEELDDVPTDASANLDHYLYGSPKK